MKMEVSFSGIPEGGIVLVSGADGLVGRQLCADLLAAGYTVHALSRRKSSIHAENHRIKDFYWNEEKGEFDDRSLEGVVALVHLAGESIGTKSWTKSRKRAIVRSRVNTIRLIYDRISRNNLGDQLKVVVSASATGYYPSSSDKMLFEDSPAGEGFLASTCMEWESAVWEGASRFGARVVRFRSGVVLARKGGMYAQLRPLAAKGLGVIMGSGKQYLPWIHLIDAARAYTYALENSQMNGVYNLASPDVITFGQFMRELATRLDQKIFLPPVPAFLVKLGLGERSELLLGSMRIFVSKLQMAGFEFKFERIEEAIQHLESTS